MNDDTQHNQADDIVESQPIMADLLVALIHWSDQNEIDFNACQRQARHRHQTEATELKHFTLRNAFRRLLAQDDWIGIFWHIDDVRNVRPDLTPEQAWRVLEECERYHNPEVGINWMTLSVVADNLFGMAPQGGSND